VISGRFTAVLACKGRRSRRGKLHRPVVIYAYDGPVPPPDNWTPRLPGSTFDLDCPRCGFMRRPGDDGMRALIEMAAGKPGRTHYIDGP
jgi:hypothetical protein